MFNWEITSLLFYIHIIKMSSKNIYNSDNFLYFESWYEKILNFYFYSSVVFMVYIVE